MRGFKARSLGTAFTTVSALALVGMPAAAHAQDAAATVGNPGPSEIQEQPATDAPPGDDIIVTGIRASLRAAIDIKRDAQGVVDAISAEDIGKFPDTNLAESLQRITGVSIDRANGEGSTVTVRGFGPEFNLVTLNGRQMPTSTLGDGASAPSSRSFDFANLASEGISAVEVYKTGRAAVPSGGIGSTINIRTPRPLDKVGTRGSIAAKGVLDTSRNVGDPITPEVSGIFSSTFGGDRFGILVSGVYQRRKASVNTASSSWRDGYLGNENNWGSLAQPGQPGSEKITNRPDPTDVYQVPQEATYALTDIDRERINGQLVLQAKIAEGLTATTDFTYSSNKVAARTNSAGIWFTFGDVSSAWTDGPVAGPIFYSEAFPAAAGKDLSYGGGFTANKSENKSLGGTLTWDAPGGVTMVLDAHSSSAESKPTTPYGSSVALGTAVFGVVNQRVDYDSYLPVISYQMRAGTDPLNPANVIATGNSFRNAYFKNEIDQVQLKGHYEHDGDFLKSIDFGSSYVDNRVRSAYGFIQNDTWGGVGSPADLPDDIFRTINIPDAFKGLQGANAPNITQNILAYDFDRLVNIVVNQFGACGTSRNCLSPYNTDRRINEKILAGFVQTGLRFDVGAMPVNVIGGVRYEHTVIDSRALVPIPTGTRWVSANEFALTLGSSSDFTRFKGEYDDWLPAIDVDISPLRNVKLRASYSHTITRASYADLQGGRTLEVNPRITNGFGSQGNPGLLPFKSKNIDLSAEWYYTPDSYISVGYFNKDVKNFVGTNRFSTTAFDLRNPASGPRYRAAVAAVGSADNVAIRNYIFRNFPAGTRQTGVDANGNIQGEILGLPEDDLYQFLITQPVNNDRTANLNGFEFAIQHSFWDTGFGTILNYTIVNGDAVYDNTLPANLTQNGVTTANAQFALTGLSDSANAVLFYDKNGIQARVAYNWRDEFLAGTGVNPFYVEAYGQVDASASWEFVPGLTAFVEAINLTGESRRGHQRSRNNAAFVTPQDARYSAGLRLNF